MEHSDFVREKDHGRFQVYEFLLVLVIVAFIIYMGIEFYSSHGKETQKTMMEFHAGVFSRMVTNVHALGKNSKDGAVVVNSTTFYLNENGWPANTELEESPSLYNQKAEECRQIWNSVFSNPPSSELVENQYKGKVRYVISLNENVICRYEMAIKGDVRYFIDYDLTNGAVKVSNSN